MEKNEPQWYVVHTYSGYESAVEDNLRNMIENNNLHDYIVDIKVPVDEEIVEKNGKRKTVLRKRFPGYVFVKMIYTNHIWFMVTNTRGVTGFVGPQGRPLPLTADEVKRNGLEVIDIEDFDIKTNDNIKVVSGALEGFVGVVEAIFPDRQKVRVIVSMFGRNTPVELDFSQVEKL